MHKIKCSNVTIGYGKKEEPILNDISFEINAGEFIGIIGNNGSGKSTLLKAIIGAIKYKGLVEIDGKVNTSQVIRNKIGFVPQLSNDVPDITVFDYVSLAFYGNKGIFTRLKESDKNDVLSAMEKVGILDIKDKMINSLSGGQRQRASIAMSLVYKKDIMIFDEPTNHLDLKSKGQIVNILKNLQKEGVTIILTLHEINEGSKLVDKFIALHNQKIAFEGKPIDVITVENIKNVFGVTPKIKKEKGIPVITDHT